MLNAACCHASSRCQIFLILVDKLGPVIHLVQKHTRISGEKFNCRSKVQNILALTSQTRNTADIPERALLYSGASDIKSPGV
jgi:hypothetical protein